MHNAEFGKYIVYHVFFICFSLDPHLIYQVAQIQMIALGILSVCMSYVEFCRSLLLQFFVRYPQSVVEHHIHNVCCYFCCDCYWIYYIVHVNFIGTMHHYMHISCKWWRKWNCIYPKWWRKFNLKFMNMCVLYYVITYLVFVVICLI